MEETFENLALAWKDLTVSSEGQPIIKNLNGYIRQNCITAVLGASAAGKSVLLQSVAGHMQDVDINGQVFMDGHQVNPKARGNPVAYVPQDDSVIGDLTAREVTRDTALLKRNETRDVIDREVQELLENLGLGHVADGIIGTLIFRGLSGGQKKRVEMASELIASPHILLLDEPTSGLDSSAAYEALSCVRDIVKSGKKRISVMLTIHQPNSKLLELFDDILLMEGGESTFFGPLKNALEHFSRCGFTCPKSITPTDFFLQVSDPSYDGEKKFDFKKGFKEASDGLALTQMLEKHEQFCKTNSGALVVQVDPVPFWKQVYVLVYREYALAWRDPTLYWFQLVMLLMFALMIGGVFWDLPRSLDENFNLQPSALLWLVLLNCWVHAFKVYYLSSGNKRSTHEISNGKYGPAAVIVADIIAVSTLTVLFIPMGAIPYFMMGFPSKAFPFLILALWMTSLAAEAMIASLTKLSTNATTSMVFAMIALVTLQVFGGGVFIPWKDVPDYWVWFQEMTVFAQGSRAVNMKVFKDVDYTCSNVIGTVCTDTSNGNQYECIAGTVSGLNCLVNGREILDVTQGISTGEDYWTYFGYLVLVYIGLKGIVAFFTYHPFESVIFKIKYAIMGPTTAVVPAKAGGATAAGGAPSTTQNIPRAVGPEKSTSFRDHTGTALSWTDFNVILPKNEAKLVDGVSGFVKSGRILALMGPSGAGKTTLLNGLANRAPYARLEGNVKFANHTMTSQDLTYVPQFDEVNDVMTVCQHITLVGKLTCVDTELMLRRVEEILDVMGLLPKRDVQVRNLSGGEIKRLSIGVGLISNPSVLFLDEPTTGLDSTAAYSIVSYLVKLARKINIAIIMTIHQPSAMVFDMLDDLFLLERGRIVYGGSIQNAKLYFDSLGFSNPDSINPADYYLELVQNKPENGKTWSELFNNSRFGVQFYGELEGAEVAQSKMSTTVTYDIPSVEFRLSTMVMHYFSYFLSEPGYFLHRVYALILIALFDGTLYLNLEPNTENLSSYVGAMFSTAIAVMLTAVASTSLFARDRREAVDRISNGFYHAGVFVFAQFIVSMIYNFIAVLVFTSIFHWLTNLNPTGEAYIYDALINWGHISVMEAMIMIFIEAFKNDFLATTAGMIFIGTNMLFSGFFRLPADITPVLSWMTYVVPLRWSFSGFLWQVFHDQDFEVQNSNMEISGEYILDNAFDLRNVDSWSMFVVLMAYVVFFRFCHYFLLAYQTNTLPFQEVKTIQPSKNARPNHSGVSTNDVQTKVEPMEIVSADKDEESAL